MVLFFRWGQIWKINVLFVSIFTSYSSLWCSVLTNTPYQYCKILAATDMVFTNGFNFPFPFQQLKRAYRQSFSEEYLLGQRRSCVPYFMVIKKVLKHQLKLQKNCQTKVIFNENKWSKERIIKKELRMICKNIHLEFLRDYQIEMFILILYQYRSVCHVVI